jgi:hypothetical protein
LPTRSENNMNQMSVSGEAVEAGYAAASYLAIGRDEIRAILEAAAPNLMADATALIRELTDPEECTFDHHGGCQAHGYLSLKTGETCPQADAKGWISGGGE